MNLLPTYIWSEKIGHKNSIIYFLSNEEERALNRESGDLHSNGLSEQEHLIDIGSGNLVRITREAT